MYIGAVRDGDGQLFIYSWTKDQMTGAERYLLDNGYKQITSVNLNQWVYSQNTVSLNKMEFTIVVATKTGLSSLVLMPEKTT